ncbi:tetratricopeptide repeat protein [candidate division KSB1 bacterium]|nr:tetratricopeptide repeat protein [candidate division KSB1 bacterium]
MKRKVSSHGKLILEMLFACLLLQTYPAISQNKEAIKWFDKGKKASKLDQKITFFLKATTIDPSYTEAYYQLALAYKSDGQLDKARQFLGRALISRPNYMKSDIRLKIVYEMGVIQHKLGQLRDAKKSLVGALNLDGEKKDKLAVLDELGQVLIETGEYDLAITYYSQAARLDPKNSQYTTQIENARRLKEIDHFYAQGIQSYRERRFQRAIANFEKVLALDENFKDAPDKLKESKHALATQKENEKEWRSKYGSNLTGLYSEDERRREIGKNLETTIKKADDTRSMTFANPSEASYHQGMAYLEEQQWEKAIQAFEFVVSISPGFLDTEEQLKKAQIGLQNSTQERILERYYEEGISLLESRQWVKSIIAFEKVLRLDPKHSYAKTRLKEAQEELKLEGAEAAKKRYYEQAMAAYYYKDWVLAVTLFEKLRNLDPKYKDVDEKLTFAQSQIDKWKQNQEWVQFYKQGEDALNGKRWLDAVIAFGKAEMLNPSYRDVKIKLLKAQDELTRQASSGTAQPPSTSVKIRMIGFWVLLVLGIIGPVIGIFIFGPSLRGRFLLVMGLHDRASKLYAQLIEKGTISDKLLMALLNLYMSQNRQDDLAIKIYERALRLNLGLDEKQKEEIITYVAQYYIQNWESDAREIDQRLEESLKTESRNIINTAD